MRLNQYIALATGISRRQADKLIQSGQVTVNGQSASLGAKTSSMDKIRLDGILLSTGEQLTVMLNKPEGYISSRAGQGGQTIYDLLPAQYRKLKPVGRLDKDSTGLILLTNDGKLANQLTHPRFKKLKIYQVKVDRALAAPDLQQLNRGVRLDDGISRLTVVRLPSADDTLYEVKMAEGRNRQIRRTFESLGYKVTKLHRITFGPFHLGDLAPGDAKQLVI